MCNAQLPTRASAPCLAGSPAFRPGAFLRRYVAVMAHVGSGGRGRRRHLLLGRLRERESLTQEELAERSGLAVTVIALERGCAEVRSRTRFARVGPRVAAE
jgi:DNA-binding XRE family transcriptional regulator